jgi:hypothetical protein
MTADTIRGRAGDVGEQISGTLRPRTADGFPGGARRSPSSSDVFPSAKAHQINAFVDERVIGRKNTGLLERQAHPRGSAHLYGCRARRIDCAQLNETLPGDGDGLGT